LRKRITVAEVAGFYVVYEDAYKSYSPAKAFEDGSEKSNTCKIAPVELDAATRRETGHLSGE
jgi:hypothetical protein